MEIISGVPIFRIFTVLIETAASPGCSQTSSDASLHSLRIKVFICQSYVDEGYKL